MLGRKRREKRTREESLKNCAQRFPRNTLPSLGWLGAWMRATDQRYMYVAWD